jgi:CBS domain-containing protein
MLLREIMKRDPLTAKDTDPLGELHRKMVTAHVRHLPVLRDGKLAGILSERDMLEYRANREFDEDWWRAPAAAAMRAPAQTAGPDDSLTEAAGRMAMSKIGALPIVELGQLIGLITVTDVLAAQVADAMR